MTIQTQKLSTLNMEWPPDWESVFDTVGQNRPLIVEIGFGYGHMLFHLAEQFPDANIIGVEVASKPIETVERRIQHRQIHNIRVLYGYAETFLHHLLAPQSVEQIHINFPDPWFKSGHVHRRVMKRQTVDAVASRLMPNGLFYLATDIDEYADMSHELLADTPALTNRFSTPWAGRIDNRVITKYERKAITEGRTNKYFAYQRNDHPAPDVALITEIEMPNIVFSTESDLFALADGFAKVTESFATDEVHVSVMNAYRNADTLLFEVFVKEPTVDQHVGFVVVPRQNKPHEYTLKLASFGHPRATLGVHRAALVLEQVIQQHTPDYRAIHHKVREL